MKITKTINELSFKDVRLTRVFFSGDEMAFAVAINGDMSFHANLAAALNHIFAYRAFTTDEVREILAALH